MKKLITGCGFLALCASLPVNAVGPGNYWAASADTVGSSFHSGIVVTDSTYTGCVTQFSNAMTNHASAHGDVFSNIQNCHYIPSTSTGGLDGGVVSLAHLDLNYAGGTVSPLPHDVAIAMKEKFINNMNSLEEEYQVAEFIKKRDQLVEEYTRRLSQGSAVKR